jgi:hypothetical protein
MLSENPERSVGISLTNTVYHFLVMKLGLALLVALVLAFVVAAALPLSHWMTPHGHVTCDGKLIPEGRVYRSRDGSFLLALAQR